MFNAIEWEEAYDWMPSGVAFAGLYLLRDGKAIDQFSLTEDETIIGRSGDIKLPQSSYPNIGNQHVLIRRTSQGVYLENLHVTFTYVNNNRVKSRKLQDGDIISLGGLSTETQTCVLRYSDEPPSLITTKM